MTNADRLAIIDRKCQALKVEAESLLGQPVKVSLSIHANDRQYDNFALTDAARSLGWAEGGSGDCCWLQSDCGLIRRGYQVTIFYSGLDG